MGFREGQAGYNQAHRYAMESAGSRPARLIQAAYRIVGALDVERLRAAFRSVIASQDALRMSFSLESGVLRYRVADEVDWDVVITDGAPADVHAALLQELYTGFDRSAAPLLRVWMWRVDPTEWLLSIVMDHIVFDGWSVEVLRQEVARSYAAGNGHVAQSVETSYPDWIDTQHAFLEGAASVAAREHWGRLLAGFDGPPSFTVPDFGFPGEPPAATSSESVPVAEVNLPRELLTECDLFCRAYRVTRFALLLAGLALCLARRNGDAVVFVYGAVANRRRGTTRTIGWFGHGVVYRMDIDGARTAAEMVREAGRSVLEVLGLQGYSMLRWRLETDPGAFGQPLSQSFVYLNDPVSSATTFALDGLEVMPITVPEEETDPVLSFFLDDGDESPRLGVFFGRAHYDGDRAVRLLDGYVRALDDLVRQPDARLSELLAGSRT